MSINIYTYAAIDIGSNAVRLLINTIYESQEKVTFNKTSLVRVPIRLGKEVFSQGKISKITVKRLEQAMTAYNLLMKVYGVEKYRAFATSAMREAINTNQVLEIIKKKSGIKIEVISGEEEAKVIFSSQLQEYLESGQNYLFVDVGGGSTEISLFSQGKVQASRSFSIGTVRLLNNKVQESYLTEVVKPWVNQILQGESVELIGSGGNINYIFKRSGKKEGKFLTKNYISEQYHLLNNLPYEKRVEDFNMKPDRADVIVPALLIYNSIMKYASATRIHVPKIGAADGMINLMYKRTKLKLKES